MSRFFSYPGSRPPQPEGSARKLRLPDIYAEKHDAQLGEFLRSRAETSHLEVGLAKGDKVWFKDGAGERRPAIVEGEERDSHSGKIDVYFRASDPTGSGTFKQTFEGDTARSLKASRTKRVFE